MRSDRLRPTFVLLCLVVASACTHRMASNSADRAPVNVWRATLAERNSRTAEVSTEELRDILISGSAVVLDTRPHLEYSIAHIPRAINVAPKPDMPMAEYTSDVAEVGRLLGGDRERPIVLYCNGPFCGKSKRVAEDLVAAGYVNVRRYQLGAPVWRALGGVMIIEPDGVRHVLENDRTAWLIDTRAPEAYQSGTVSRAKNVRAGEVHAAKNDGRLPMHDHNTRVIVVGETGAAARAVAEELMRNAFHNVMYFDGTYDTFSRITSDSSGDSPMTH